MNEANPGSFGPPARIVVATRNPHKLDEIRAILGGSGIEVVSLDSFPDAPEVVEDRPDLKGNAARKAETLHALTGLPTMADDTGLEVDALGGRPGVHSARYAGEDATDADNRRKLLAELAGESDRSARFRTVIAFATDDGTEFFEGACEGTIIAEERGAGGFGYDPVFRPDGTDRTFGELSADEKNQISHRARAARAFARRLGAEVPA
jgi:XTP/dITP diphosphohydrolase